MPATRTNNRTNSIRMGCALSLLFGLAGGILFFIRYQSMISCRNNDRQPLVIMNATSDPNQSKALIEQFRKFAFKHNFRFDVVNPVQNSNDFRIRILGKDVEIITRKPSTPSEFRIEFYNSNCTHPTLAADVTDLVVDLKGVISEIPNVTITEVAK